MKVKPTLVELSIALILACIIGMLIGSSVQRFSARSEAIEHGAAQYNPTSGRFEWK